MKLSTARLLSVVSLGFIVATSFVSADSYDGPPCSTGEAPTCKQISLLYRFTFDPQIQSKYKALAYFSQSKYRSFLIDYNEGYVDSINVLTADAFARIFKDRKSPYSHCDEFDDVSTDHDVYFGCDEATWAYFHKSSTEFSHAAISVSSISDVKGISLFIPVTTPIKAIRADVLLHEDATGNLVPTLTSEKDILDDGSVVFKDFSEATTSAAGSQATTQSRGLFARFINWLTFWK